VEFLEELPVEKFYGVGKVTANKMFSLGIYKGKDLKKRSLEDLVRIFGKSGKHYYNVVRGIHTSVNLIDPEKRGGRKNFFEDLLMNSRSMKTGKPERRTSSASTEKQYPRKNFNLKN
jgi:DNA polymerase-4